MTRQKITLKVAAVAAILIALVLLWLSIINYATAHQIADRLTPDGSMDSFTPERFQQLIVIMRELALVFIAFGVFSLLAPARVLSFIRTGWMELKAALSGWPHDAAAAFREIRLRLLRKNLLVPMVALALLALLIRLAYINDPITHDEAYSFVMFARLPLRLGLSDYHFPNNHLFHTLLVHISWRLFGTTPLAVRLPALIAGVGVIPSGYLLARRLYGKTAALIAAAALIASPALILYATIARGYSLLALLTLLVMILAVELTHSSNLFLWSLAALFSALGFYTLPVFLMPFGIIVTWLILSGFSKRAASSDRASWFTRLFLFVVSTLILTGLLYLPVLLNTGLSSIISNQWVASLSWKDFWPTLASRLMDTGGEWTSKVPLFVTVLALIGLGLSVVFHRRISREQVSTQLAALIFIPIILLVQRPNAWAKIWQFLLPLVLIWAGAGLVGGLKWIETKVTSRIAIVVSGTGAIVVGLLVLAGFNTLQDHPGLKPIQGPVEQSAVYFTTHLQEKDIVVIAPIDDAPLWYYFNKYGLSEEYFRRDVPFKQAYVLVSRDQDQTIDTVLKVRGPDAGFLDRSTTRLIESWGNLDLYSIEADWQAVSKAYQLVSP